ncbi:MAG: hypothetical protein ACKVX9_12595 [Blastocatellia bacterium]
MAEIQPDWVFALLFSDDDEKKKNGTDGNHGTDGAEPPCAPFVPFFPSVPSSSSSRFRILSGLILKEREQKQAPNEERGGEAKARAPRR